MPTGAHGTLLPIHSTKTGAGDKERAYVVRQNFFLKIVLVAVATIVGLAVTLCCTTYEIHVQRRDSLHDAREHREEEHTSHMKVMRLSMLLQQRRLVATAAEGHEGPLGQQLDTALVFAEGKDKGRADPAFEAHSTPVIMWAKAVWNEWLPHSSLQGGLDRAKSRLAQAPSG